MQEGSRNSYYALTSSFKEKAPVEGTPPSAVSGLAAFSSDGLNFFQNSISVFFLSLFVFCTSFFSFGTMLFKRLEKRHFQRLKSVCYELEGIPLDFFCTQNRRS